VNIRPFLDEAERLAQDVYLKSEPGSDVEKLAMAMQALINAVGHMARDKGDGE
jgi:hypothetical protein